MNSQDKISELKNFTAGMNNFVQLFLSYSFIEDLSCQSYSCTLQCPDYFVVGYGMDYAELYRNLPYVGILKPEIYTK